MDVSAGGAETGLGSVALVIDTVNDYENGVFGVRCEACEVDERGVCMQGSDTGCGTIDGLI